MSAIEELREKRRQMQERMDTLTALCKANASRPYPWKGRIIRGPDRGEEAYHFPGLSLKVRGSPPEVYCNAYDPNMFDKAWILEQFVPAAAEILGARSRQAEVGEPVVQNIPSSELAGRIAQLVDLQEMICRALELDLAHANYNTCTTGLEAAMANAQAVIKCLYGYGMAKGIFEPRQLVLDDSAARDGLEPVIAYYHIAGHELDASNGYVEFLQQDGKVTTLPVEYLDEKAPGWRELLPDI